MIVMLQVQLEEAEDRATAAERTAISEQSQMRRLKQELQLAEQRVQDADDAAAAARREVESERALAKQLKEDSLMSSSQQSRALQEQQRKLLGEAEARALKIQKVPERERERERET